MSIKANIDINCDYCGKRLYDGETVACKKCMERLEEENGELKKEIEALKEELAEAKKEDPLRVKLTIGHSSDGYWLFIGAPSGKHVGIHLEGARENTICSEILEEASKKEEPHD